MIDGERISREKLLERAVIGMGLVWAAPQVASAANVDNDAKACTKRRCKPGPRGNKRCARKGCGACAGNGFCACGGCCGTPCMHTGAQCDVLEGCGSFDCACFLGANGGSVCVETGQMCSDFQPCGAGNTCPAGFVCFLSCCRTPLCGSCCRGIPTPRQRRGGRKSELTR
jgi:hypothetical protein